MSQLLKFQDFFNEILEKIQQERPFTKKRKRYENLEKWVVSILVCCHVIQKIKLTKKFKKRLKELEAFYTNPDLLVPLYRRDFCHTIEGINSSLKNQSFSHKVTRKTKKKVSKMKNKSITSTNRYYEKVQQRFEVYSSNFSKEKKKSLNYQLFYKIVKYCEVLDSVLLDRMDDLFKLLFLKICKKFKDDGTLQPLMYKMLNYLHVYKQSFLKQIYEKRMNQYEVGKSKNSAFRDLELKKRFLIAQRKIDIDFLERGISGFTPKFNFLELRKLESEFDIDDILIDLRYGIFYSVSTDVYQSLNQDKKKEIALYISNLYEREIEFLYLLQLRAIEKEDKVFGNNSSFGKLKFSFSRINQCNGYLAEEVFYNFSKKMQSRFDFLEFKIREGNTYEDHLEKTDFILHRRDKEIRIQFTTSKSLSQKREQLRSLNDVLGYSVELLSLSLDYRSAYNQWLEAGKPSGGPVNFLKAEEKVELFYKLLRTIDYPPAFLFI